MGTCAGISLPLDRHNINICSTHPVLSIDDAEKGEENERIPRHFKLIPSGTSYASHSLVMPPLTGRSFRDALGAPFQPINTGDPCVDFYAMYKREATGYDADDVK